MKLIVATCEGPHDVAFLSRVLNTDDFSNSTKIDILPPKIQSLISKRMSELNINDLAFKIGPEIPLVVLKKYEYDIIVLMHSAGGKDNTEAAKNIIKVYQPLLTESDLPSEGKVVDYLAFVHIIDANGAEPVKNETIFKKVFKDIYPGIHNEKTGHGEIIRFRGDACLGCFIFSADGKTGKLEDIMIPLMAKDNETVFDDARQYVDKHCSPENFDKDKAIVGITGQLCEPGSSNVVIIRDSRYITDAKIEDNNKCREIKRFFSRLPAP